MAVVATYFAHSLQERERCIGREIADRRAGVKQRTCTVCNSRRKLERLSEILRDPQYRVVRIALRQQVDPLPQEISSDIDRNVLRRRKPAEQPLGFFAVAGTQI